MTHPDATEIEDEQDGVEEPSLSDKQLLVLEAAVRLGYFAVPRDCTLEDVAAACGISHQAASERLRRAQRTVFHHVFPRGVNDAE